MKKSYSILLCLLCLLCFFVLPVVAGVLPPPAQQTKKPPQREHFFYGGLIGGYADIDWSSTVAQDPSAYASDPIEANGNGALFGGDIGYQISPHFALELEYIQMPSSYLKFNPAAMLTYGVLSTTTQMNFAALMIKFMAPISDTNVSLFTDVGAAYQHISDDITDTGTFAPTFGAGFNYRINEHWMTSMSFQYATGYGESIALPMTEYIPEVYAYTFGINYIF
jgi:hypothetical protein